MINKLLLVGVACAIGGIVWYGVSWPTSQLSLKNEQEPEPKMSDSKPITRPSSDLLEEKAESLFDKEHEPIPNKAGMARTFALDENPHMESLAEAFDGDKVVRPERLTAFDK